MVESVIEFRDLRNEDLAKIPFANKFKKLYKLKISIASGSSVARVGSGVTNIFDGVATPVKVDVVSGQAADTVAGTGAQKVYLFGISSETQTGTFIYYLESIDMNGVTPVTSGRYYKRLINIYVYQAGSGKTSAGNITVHEVGGTTQTYLTIIAGSLCSANGQFFVGTGFKARFAFLHANCIQAAGAAAAVLDSGAKVFPISDDTGSGLTLDVVEEYTVLPNGDLDKVLEFGTVEGNNNTFFSVDHQGINSGALLDMFYEMCILIA